MFGESCFDICIVNEIMIVIGFFALTGVLSILLVLFSVVDIWFENKIKREVKKCLRRKK